MFKTIILLSLILMNFLKISKTHLSTPVLDTCLLILEQKNNVKVLTIRTENRLKY